MSTGNEKRIGRPAVHASAADNIKHRDHAPVQRNASQWRSIAYFLAGIEVLAHGGQAGQAQRCTALDVDLQAIPDGNHGDNRRSIK